MTITKNTIPDAILFRFDPEQPGRVKGCAYYDRTVVKDGDEVISSVENPAQPVSIAASVPGLDLQAILGTALAGATVTVEQQAGQLAEHEATIETMKTTHAAELAAKDANIQDLMDQAARLQALLDAEIRRNGVTPELPVDVPDSHEDAASQAGDAASPAP